jgi:hypothetical protein
MLVKVINTYNGTKCFFRKKPYRHFKVNKILMYKLIYIILFFTG